MSSKGILQFALVSVWIFGAAMTCFAQAEAPIAPQEVGPSTGPQEVGPSTGDRVIDERPVQREQVGQRTVVEERVVERPQEGEVYVGGFGGLHVGTRLY